jgi:molecular chaperone DnaK
MVKDAEQHADDDKKRREIVDTKNQADQLIYQTEKSLKENEDKITGDDKSSIESAVEKLKESAKGENVEEIKAAMEGVNNAWAPVASKLYADASAQEQPEPGPETTGGEAEKGEEGEKKVEDADFEVIDDQEK